jgi:hypothetical protein
MRRLGMEERYEVVWPGGAAQATASFQGRPASPLHGRKVAFFWNNIFNGEVLWEIVGGKLASDYQVELVGSEGFGNFMGPNAEEVLEVLPERLRQSGVDSVIVGMGA